MKKLALLCVLLAMFVAGCGKKDSKPAKKGSKTLASNVAPVYKEESENFFDDEGVQDFAFVDDEKKADNKKLAGADVVGVDGEEKIIPLAQNEENLEEEPTGEGVAFKTVHFDFNKNNIRQDQQDIVEEDCKAAEDAVKQGKKVVVQGHCCQIGSYSYNMALSQRRAEAVKKSMIDSGINADDIKTVGYGNELPLVWSDKKDRKSLIQELAPNRRAEVVVN